MKLIIPRTFLRPVCRHHAVFFKRCTTVALACAGFALSGTVKAQDAFYDGGGADNAFGTPQNWSADLVPTGTATFNQSSATVGGKTTLSVGGPFNLGIIAFNTANAAAYTIGSSAGDGTFTSNNGTPITMAATVANNQTVNSNLVFTVNAATIQNSSSTNTLTLNGGISGGNAGASMLTLTGVGSVTNVINGAIANGTAPSLGVTIGAGNWTLNSSANTFGGRVQTATDTINATTGVSLAGGTLVIGSNAALGTDSVFVTGTTGVIQAGGGARTIANGIVANNASYTISGSNALTVSGNVSFNGTNTLTINNSALTTIGGQLQLRNRTTSNGGITVNGTGTIVVSGSIVDSQGGNNNAATPVALTATGSLTYSGTGTFKRTGADTYTGATNVNGGGTMLVNGSHVNATTYTVGATGATPSTGVLGGTGSIALAGSNTVFIRSTGTLAPGDGMLAASSQTGSLGIGKLTLDSGATFQLQLGGNTAGDGQGFYDQVNVTSTTAGALTLSTGNILNVSLVNGFTPSSSDIFYVLTRADSSATAAGFGAQGSTFTFADGITTGQITYLANWTGTEAGSTLTGGNDFAVYNIMPVPEPGTYAMVLGGAVLLVGLQRGRRRRA